MSLFAILWRGALMGLAEVVPGVSGGTMALVTGIYQRLITSIASFGPSSFGLLKSPQKFYVHHHLSFLLPLVLGMAVGIVVFAQFMGFLLVHYKPVVWGFFFGVILASVFVIGRLRSWLHLLTFGLVGLLLASLVLLAGQAQGTPTVAIFFFAGMVAVSAWILPAISGSYVLLLMGLYEPVIAAVRSFDLATLVSLAAGCVTGLLLFVRLLDWLLKRWYEPLLAMLTGFMLGSVVNLWPWQVDSASRLERLVLPAEYSTGTGEPALIFSTIVAFVLGSLFLWLISKQQS